MINGVEFCEPWNICPTGLKRSTDGKLCVESCPYWYVDRHEVYGEHEQVYIKTCPDTEILKEDGQC